MQRSAERILTTHVGSLPRPPDLLDMLEGKGRDDGTRLRDAVAEIVRKQIELGIDVIDDGEFGKPSFVSYVNERLAGFEPNPEAAKAPWSGSREALAFPEFYAEGHVAFAPAPHGVHRSDQLWRPGPAQERHRQSEGGARRHAAEDVFMPAVSPSDIEHWQSNAYYKTQEEYLFAIAEAMREEYEAIIEAGFILQIDDPRLVTY